MPGTFVTFEGGEGTGKSTQLKLLADVIMARGLPLVQTREPGGTPEAEALRTLLVNGDPGRWTAEAEALLNYAARASHLQKIIRPALASGKFVLCDRFSDSTRAYQGYAGGCDLKLLDALEASIVGRTRPALTLILDIDPAMGLARAKSRADGSEDRYERKGLKFHQRLRAGFLQIAAAEPKRCKVIDASGSIGEVTARVLAAVEPVLNG
ncbi:MAG: dTMP kinase [Rhizobiales bacterium]|jgi:dTMP kinase|nr:dTMP kinase [Hyphomicrobiales bacterium]